jgi:hypothetical protein
MASKFNLLKKNIKNHGAINPCRRSAERIAVTAARASASTTLPDIGAGMALVRAPTTCCRPISTRSAHIVPVSHPPARYIAVVPLDRTKAARPSIGIT